MDDGNLNKCIDPSFTYIDGEIWKDIERFENVYQISNLGRFINVTSNPYIFIGFQIIFQKKGIVYILIQKID